MELRLLTTERERNIFASHLAEARARHGTGFEDVHSTVEYNQARLQAASVYALFERDDDLPERMIAGVTLHDLECFQQSCSLPDLTYMPPRSVLECSDHWSLSRGAGIHAWRGIAVQVVQRQPRAVLIYLAVRGADHAGFYSAMGFVEAGPPVEYTHLQRSDRATLWVQPMILDGEALARLTASVRDLRVDSLNNYQIVRFSKSDRLRPSARVGTQMPGAAVAARAGGGLDAVGEANV